MDGSIGSATMISTSCTGFGSVSMGCGVVLSAVGVSVVGDGVGISVVGNGIGLGVDDCVGFGVDSAIG